MRRHGVGDVVFCRRQCWDQHDRVLADLDSQRVEEDHRVHRLERSGLPGADVGHDAVGDATD